MADLEQQGVDLDFMQNLDNNEDLRSLKQIIVYGLRGMAAYANHAAILGQEEQCCGDSARRLGNESLSPPMASTNLYAMYN